MLFDQDTGGFTNIHERMRIMAEKADSKGQNKQGINDLMTENTRLNVKKQSLTGQEKMSVA